MSALRIPPFTPVPPMPSNVLPLSPAHIAHNATLAARIAVFRGRALPRAAWCRIYSLERSLTRKPLLFTYTPQG